MSNNTSNDTSKSSNELQNAIVSLKVVEEKEPSSNKLSEDLKNGNATSTSMEVKNHTQDAATNAISRKQSSSNITDILNLGDLKSDDDQAVEKKESDQHKKNSPKVTNAEKHKHRSPMAKKRRHIKKRKWRSYERAITRVRRDRDELLAAGVALAPHNTSGFLIKDHQISSPNDDEIRRRAEHCENEEYDYEGDKEFQEVYETIRNSFYDKLTKVQLVERWIEAEDRIETLEKKLATIREKKRLLGLSGKDIASEMAKIEVFKEEINKLIVENDELARKNEEMRRMLSENP